MYNSYFSVIYVFQTAVAVVAEQSMIISISLFLNAKMKCVSIQPHQLRGSTYISKLDNSLRS